MNKFVLPFFLGACLLSSCCKDSSYTLLDVLLPTSPYSKTECDDTKATAFADRYTALGQLRNVQVSDGSKVLIANSKALYWTDLNTGKVLNTVESKVAGRAFSNTEAIYRNGDLAIAASSTGLAVVNAQSGELLWERQLGDCDISKGVYGLGDQYFVTRHVPDSAGVVSDAVFVGNLREPGHLDLLCTPVYTHNHHAWAGYGHITALAPFSGADGHTYLLLSYFETRPATNYLDVFVALYDVTAQTWVYENRPLPSTNMHVQQIEISGSTAYMKWQGKILIWELAAGQIMETLPAGSGTDGFRQFVLSGRYLLATNNSGVLQVWNSASRTLLYKLPSVGYYVQAEPGLDRLFVNNPTGITVHELSTGKELERIEAPCVYLSEENAIWKDIYGAIHVAVNGDDKIYHYVLQN